mgnify:FL=1
MKKFYLSLCTIGIAVASFAQQNDVRNSEMSLKSSKFHHYTSSQEDSKAPPFWQDDFSDASLWTMTDYAHNGAQNWVIGTAAPSGGFSNGMGAIASTTAANGFAMYDSDALATSASNVQDASLTFNNSIDCSQYQYINLNVETYHRKFQDSVFVEVSNDNVNWDRYEMHVDLDVNDGSANPEFASINISSTAGNQTTVWIRFRYEGQWDYAWMLDDVSLSETPNNAASITDAVQGGWWVNYINVAGGALAGFDYTFNTNSQIAINPYSFEAVLHNDGVAPQNMILNAEVLNDQGISVFSSMSNSILLDMSNAVDTFVCNNTFTPSVNGVYEIRLWGTGDSVMTDTAILMTVVNDDVYARDWNQPAGTWRVARDCGGMVLGTSLDIYTNETLYALQVHIDDESVVGTPLYVALYENSTDPNSDPVYLSQSDDYILTANDIDNWITVPFDGGQDLFAGTSYLAAVGGYASPLDTFKVNVSGESQGATCWIQDNGCDLGSAGFGAWYWISDIPMIRMSFDPAALSTDNVVSGEFNVYPNPTTGVFIVELNNIKADDYKISVTNVLGQEVYTSTKELTTLFSERIDLSSFDKGVYILEISNSESAFSEKIIIE